MGGAFASHPEQCQIIVTAKAGNPLHADTTPFAIFDEHYMMDLDDKKANVFLTTSSEHGTQPAGWTRHEGTGRVCVLTPGHNLEVWLNPAYQDLIQRALAWCATLESK
jgi:type 1 glutamine amidotransferase